MEASTQRPTLTRHPTGSNRHPAELSQARPRRSGRRRRRRRRHHRADRRLPADARRPDASRCSNASAAPQIDTGHTTAHLTMVTDQRCSRAGRRASAAITRRRPGTRGSPRSRRSTRSSTSEYRVRLRLGARLSARAARRSRPAATPQSFRDEARWRASWDSTPSSSTRCRSSAAPACAFDDQARFHPRKYLAGARAGDRRPRRA